MITRAAKIALVAGIALFYSLVVFNNSQTSIPITVCSPRSLYGFHFSGQSRPVAGAPSPAFHLAFYLGIIAWRLLPQSFSVGRHQLASLAAPLCGCFNSAKRVPVLG